MCNGLRCVKFCLHLPPKLINSYNMSDKPTLRHLQPWDAVKEKRHNTSNLKNGDEPNNYLYELSEGVYYPAICLADVIGVFEVVNMPTTTPN